MISAKFFLTLLESKGFTFFTGVPCSFFTSIIDEIKTRPKLRYVVSPNEGTALATASGAHLAGKKPVVMIQNSGLGNFINPLTSLNLIYRMPVLILISGRAYGIPDEPQHHVMGKSMGALLDSIEIKHEDLPQEEGRLAQALDKSIYFMDQKKIPFVFFVRKNTFALGKPKQEAVSSDSLKRMDAITMISKCVMEHDFLIATTGKTSRELFTVCDRNNNFYMQGSMGHASSIAFGVALEKPDRKIIILDGDGAFLMHMGSLSSIGHYQPKNLYHLVLDNESYETTGDQDTTSATTDFVKVALACGYLNANECNQSKPLEKKLKTMLKQNGPALLRIKINRLPTADIPRITTKYSSDQIALNFSTALKQSQDG
jgi:phosphonopyruvate decarboxylase